MAEQFIRVVFSTKELLQLWHAADRAGAKIAGVDTLEESAGIRVTLRSNSQRQF